MEDEDAVGPACFGPRIRDEPFPKGFSLPRDTPKYNGTVKPEDWLTDYATAIGIAGGNKRVAVRYVPLMLLGSARTWLNSLKARCSAVRPARVTRVYPVNVRSSRVAA
jgi:hypothetical protein